jgi:polysaccharide pyruvyl transferase WcaK-like protein
LSVRGFDSLYRHDPKAALRKLIDLANLLEKRGHQVGVLIQSDVNAADTDRPIAEAIAAHQLNVRIFDLFDNRSGHPPVRSLLGVMHLANIVIGLRYHAAVLRLASGRQPYNLFYSRKGRDLGERLSLTGCGLDAFDPEQEIAAIEATAQRAFAAAPVARDVTSAFDAGFKALA